MPFAELDPTKTWLFCFTHPDDEISICAWMRRLVRSGADVWAGWSVSDPVREAEGRRAMSEIGVQQDRLMFFRFPDKGACDHLPGLSSSWASLIEKCCPHRIAIGAFECGHLDHDSTNFAVRKALDALGANVPMLEIPLYHTYLTRIPTINRFATDEPQEILTLQREEQRFKWKIAKMYESQNISSLLVWYTLLSFAKLRPVGLRKTERFRLQTHFDYMKPNLPKPLAQKVVESSTWKRWREAVSRFEFS